MVKTVVQITLIVMNKTVKRADQVTHGFIFTGSMLLYVLFIAKIRPYNYERYSWWQIMSIIGVI